MENTKYSTDVLFITRTIHVSVVALLRYVTAVYNSGSAHGLMARPYSCLD